jgi:hypothetical protein
MVLKPKPRLDIDPAVVGRRLLGGETTGNSHPAHRR